jgi:putative transposase
VIRVAILKPKFNATERKYLIGLQRQAGRLWSKMLDQFWYEWRQNKNWINYGKSKGGYEKVKPLIERYAPDLPRKCAVALSCDFAEAFRAMKEKKANGDTEAKYPYKKKKYRSVTWPAQALQIRGDTIILGRIRHSDAPQIAIAIPEEISQLSPKAFKQITIKWRGGQYEVHLTYDDGILPLPQKETGKALAIDIGWKRFWIATDGESAWGFKSGALLSIQRGHNKHKGHIRRKLDNAKRGSNRKRDLLKRKAKRAAQYDDRMRNFLHQSSRALVDIAIECGADTIVLGDVKGIQGSKRMRHKEQQKLSQWPRFKWEQYVEYKAKEVGIKIERRSESYTSKTCPACGHRHRNAPSGRVFTCEDCGWVGDRDLVGAINILSVFKHGEPGKIAPPTGRIKYRQVDAWKGVKSRRAAGDSPVPVTEPCGTVGLGLTSNEAGAISGKTQLPLADSSAVRAATLKTGLASALAGVDLNHLDLPLSLED